MNNKTRRNLRCHPKIGNIFSRNSQCYPDELYKDMKKRWNKKNAGIKSRKIHVSDNALIKDRLYNLNPNCDNDICILKNVYPKETVKKYMNYYVPIANWTKDPELWLNTTDIENVLKQYEEVYPSFTFLGVCPIDWELRRKREDECICKRYCELSLQAEKDKGYTKIGGVFNLDEHDEPGSHWVAFYIDSVNKKFNYFDSEGGRCPDRIKKLYHNLCKSPENKYLTYDSNYKVKHQYTNSECGIYCIYFIIDMIRNNDFNKFKAKNKRIKDIEMKNLRNIYFNLL